LSNITSVLLDVDWRQIRREWWWCHGFITAL